MCLTSAGAYDKLAVFCLFLDRCCRFSFASLSFGRSIAWLFLVYFAWTLTANRMTPMQYSFTFQVLSASLGQNRTDSPPMSVAPY